MVIPVLNFLNYSFIKWYNPVWGGTYVSPSVFIMAVTVTPSQYCGSRRDKRSTSLLNVLTDVFNNWRCTDRARHYYSWVAIFILNNWTSGQEEVWCWFEMWHHCIVLSQRSSLVSRIRDWAWERCLWCLWWLWALCEGNSGEAVLLKPGSATTRMWGYKHRHTLNILPQTRLWDLLRGM